jgi:ABC-type polar amino acid transport system ATPase subunit
VETAKPLVEIQGVKKTFAGGPTVLRGVDLTVLDAQLTVLIGGSGCGKSTLLRCLNGLEIFDEGRVQLDDIILERKAGSRPPDAAFHALTHRLRRKVGMVFQSFNLFPHMTALENVARPPVIVQKKDREESRARALELLDKVGLKDRADHYPRQLSGGQQQRAAIARALAMQPKVILYDEPTSALDPRLSEEVLGVMRKLDDEGITQIVVTHEMRFARDVADKVVFLAEGLVVEEGEPAKIFSDPADPRTREFLRRYL